MKRLKIIMSVFGFSFVLRFAFNFIMSLYMVQFASFLYSYPGFSQLMLFGYYFVTDTLPIGMIFYMHYVNYRFDDEERRAQQVRLALENERENDNYNRHQDEIVDVMIR